MQWPTCNMEEFEEPKTINEGMKQGLARMYGDAFMREYLQNAIAIAKKNSLTLLGLGQYENARDYLSRSKSLEQLLTKGKEHFTHFKAQKTPNLEVMKVEEIKL